MKPQNNNLSRRSFMKNTMLTGTLLPLYGNVFSMFNNNTDTRLKIHIFSKHLQFLNYEDMAAASAEMGFDGVDLTVRPDGHVLPERVESDLPRATETMRKVGLAPLMMVTAVQDADNSTDKKVLETAVKLGIQYYRMNWYSYPKGTSIPESLRNFQQQIRALSLLNKELGLTGCYQN